MVQNKSKTMHKRKRTENWTAKDKSLLRKLCAERINIIENKCVDTDTNRLKRDCWIQITEAFNSVSETKRDVVRIQFQWRNMKMKAKTAESAYQKAINQTDAGGGPPPPSPSKEDRELMELISNAFKIEKHVFDSDGVDVQIKDENVSVDLSEGFADDYKDFEKDYFIENNQSQDNESVNYSDLQPLTKKMKKGKKVVHDSEASQKRELFELTKAHMTEEHEARMAILAVEKQCRLKELENLELKMELLRK